MVCDINYECSKHTHTLTNNRRRCNGSQLFSERVSSSTIYADNALFGRATRRVNYKKNIKVLLLLLNIYSSTGPRALSLPSFDTFTVHGFVFIAI